MTTNGWTNFFRGLANDGVQGPAVASYMLNTLKYKKVCVVQDNSDYGVGLAEVVTTTLGSVATIEHNAGEQEIRRENLQRNIAVTGRLEGVDLGSGIQRVQAAVAALHIPSSVRIQYGGTYEEQQKSFS